MLGERVNAFDTVWQDGDTDTHMIADRNLNDLTEMPPDAADAESPVSSKRRGDFGIEASKQLGTLEGEVERLRAEAEQSPDAQRALRVAEKKVELFVYEHDNAGAFKFKRFGREVAGMFEEKDGVEKRITVDVETGELKLAESEKNRRVMFVNMGELDRINKEGGGHAAGDKALEETVRVIEGTVRRHIGDKKGNESKYQMLRYRGNEFMVSFDSVSSEDFEEILSDVRDARPRVEGVADAVPLVADGFNFQEAVDIVNQLQAELSPEERIDGSDSGAAASEVVEVMRNRADWSLNVDKFISRVTRVREKIGNESPDEARAFFENYMQKMFRGTELAEIDAFKKLTREDTERLAFEYASKGLSDAKNEHEAKRAVVELRVKEIRSRRDRISAYPASLASSDIKLAVIPSETKGELALKKKSAALAEAKALGDLSAIEEATLDYQIENARRDSGTGLLERGLHYEELQNAFKEGKPVSLAFVDMGFLRYFDNKGGPDVGDSALRVASDLMEKAIEKSGVDAKAYRYGGDEFTVQVQGDERELRKFQDALGELRDAAGAVPSGRRGDADGYVPTELVFNSGSSDTSLTEDVFSSLKEAGAYTEQQLSNPDDVANMKAELMTVIADKSIETDKAVNRFLMLAEALRDPNYGKDPSRTTQVDMLISFSNKALFAEAGGAEYLRSLAASGKEAPEMRKDVEVWVADRVQGARMKEGKKDSLLAELIEIHGKIRYFERALADARHETDEARAKNAQLVKELKRARDERQSLIEVRKTLGP